LRGARTLYEEVAEGDPLGALITVFGDPVAEIVAPVRGTVWAARATPAVRGGELVYTIAVA
jgi:predicted deacylase